MIYATRSFFSNSSCTLLCVCVSLLNGLLQLFMISRRKSDVENGKLVELTESILLCPESALQRDIAHSVYLKNRYLLEKYSNNCGESSSMDVPARICTKLHKALDMLIRAASHPYLFDISREYGKDDAPTDDLFYTSGKLYMLNELLLLLKREGRKVLLVTNFTVMADILEVFLYWQQFSYFRTDAVTQNRRLRKIFSDKLNAKGIIFF